MYAVSIPITSHPQFKRAHLVLSCACGAYQDGCMIPWNTQGSKSGSSGIADTMKRCVEDGSGLR